MDEYGDIGSAVRRRREALGWTQQLAAERTNLSVEGYARVERGQTLPALETLVRICRGLECRPDELLGWTEMPRSVSADPHYDLRQRVRGWVDDLDEAGLRLVEHTARFAWERRTEKT